MSDIQFNTGVIRPVECLKEGYELIKPDFWLLLAITFVGGIIGSASFCILLGAMVCGINYCYLGRLDGRKVSFDDLWKGFDWWRPGLVVAAFIVIPMAIVYGIIYAPLIVALAMGSKLGGDELMGLFVGALLLDLVLVVIMVCFHTLLIFAFPLIVDRKLGPIKAMTTSARAVLKNLGGVAGLIGAQFVLVFLGLLAVCIGVYLVMPVIIAGNMVAYRKVFPRQEDFGAAPDANPGS
jgi:hypothetical protein